MKKFKAFFAALPTVVLTPVCRIFHLGYLPFVEEWEGLGNRVKGLANFWSLGYHRLLVLWNVEQWVSSSFNELFHLDQGRVMEFTNKGSMYKFFKMFFRRFVPNGIIRVEQPFWSFIVPRQFQKQEYLSSWSFLPSVEVFSIDFRFNAIGEDIREYYRPFFTALEPSPIVWERIRTIMLPKDVVTVQIRNSGLKEDAKDVATIESFFRVMDSYDQKQRFFISTMTSDMAKKFYDRYGDRCFELPNKDYTSMIDAVADMWLLGHGRELIASPNSTFSEVAWWWGGAKIPVWHLQKEFNQANV